MVRHFIEEACILIFMGGIRQRISKMFRIREITVKLLMSMKIKKEVPAGTTKTVESSCHWGMGLKTWGEVEQETAVFHWQSCSTIWLLKLCTYFALVKIKIKFKIIINFPHRWKAWATIKDSMLPIPHHKRDIAGVDTDGSYGFSDLSAPRKNSGHRAWSWGPPKKEGCRLWPECKGSRAQGRAAGNWDSELTLRVSLW